jgi:hypothetical protein
MTLANTIPLVSHMCLTMMGMHTISDFQTVVDDLRAEEPEAYSRGVEALFGLVGADVAPPASVLRVATDVCCALVREDPAYRAADEVRLAAGRVLSLLVRKLGDYTCADLRGADLIATQAVDFDGCRLVGVNLTGANLGTASFEKATLPGARLIGANASLGAVLSGADLTGAELDGFNAVRANVANATVSGARACGMRLLEAQGGKSVWIGADHPAWV